MKTVNTAKEVKIVIPFIYDNEQGRIVTGKQIGRAHV